VGGCIEVGLPGFVAGRDGGPVNALIDSAMRFALASTPSTLSPMRFALDANCGVKVPSRDFIADEISVFEVHQLALSQYVL